jgi:hypothetical protein
LPPATFPPSFLSFSPPIAQKTFSFLGLLLPR